MQIDQVLKKSPKANKNSKRLGRGVGSGTGKTSGRGHKGQKSRAGAKRRIGFEGGQMPLIRRIPKRGFNNPFSKKYQIVNVKELSKFKSDDLITPEELLSKGIIKSKTLPVKLLGNGEVKKSIKVNVHKISNSARKKIEDSGGQVIII